MITTLLRALASRWPVVLAWFLAAWIARLLLLRFAGYVGNYSGLAGLLLLPLAVMARMGGWFGMFLAVRDALPNLRDARAARVLREGPSRRRELSETVLAGVVPFFLIYAAWGMLSEDGLAYTSAAADQFGNAGATDRPLEVGLGWLPITALVVALALRWLLGRFAERLPRGVAPLGVYLEAVWVLMTIFVIQDLVELALGWLGTRRLIVPIIDAIDTLRSDTSWFAPVSDAIGWIANALGDVVAQPLAWFALAAVVFATLLPPGPPRDPAASRTARWSAGAVALWNRQPRWLRRFGEWASGDLRDRWVPFGRAAALLRHTGAATIATYLLLFAVTVAAHSWIEFALFRVLGPHDLGFWIAASDPIALIADALVAPVQLVLVAAALDTAIGRAPGVAAISASAAMSPPAAVNEPAVSSAPAAVSRSASGSPAAAGPVH